MNRKDCDKQHSERGRKRRHPGLLAAGVAMCCAAPATAQSVRVLPAALIDRDQIRLVDVAVLEGLPGEQLQLLQTVEIGTAPDFGQNRSVSLVEVRERIASAGANLATLQLKGASICVVRRPLALTPTAPASGKNGATPTSAQSLRANIIRFLEDKLADYGGGIEVDFGRTPVELLELSAPDHSFEIELAGGRTLGSVDLRVTIRRGEEQPRIQRLTVDTVLRKEVVVAATAIGRGQLLSQSDLTVAEHRFQRVEDLGLSDLRGVIGQEARRPIRVGEIISQEHIKSRLLVKRNDLVHIRCATGGIELAATATALQPGCLGDVIELVNNASGKTFWARITGLRQATVLDEPFEKLTSIQQMGGRP